MQLFVTLGSDVIEKSIHVVAQAAGHTVAQSSDAADAIITNDLRQMVSLLKQGKRVIQFLTQPSEEPAMGLLTAYPELFTLCCIVPHKGVDGCETLINFLFTNSPKEKP